MRIENTLLVADKVMKEVNKKFVGYKDKKVHYIAKAPYDNGRERGYRLALSKEAIFLTTKFAENRSSDDIVVYPGNSFECAMKTGLTDEEYENAVYFDAGDYKGAAQFIFEFLTEQNLTINK